MSRRNSASRRRAYGRRLHEMRERRAPREPARGWLDELDDGGDANAPVIEQRAGDEWRTSPAGGGASQP